VVTKKNIDPAEPKYLLEELTAHSDALFGCRPEAVTGAVHGKSKNEYTVAEMRQLINNFLNRKVNG
jgi:hypothetical protein